MPPPQLKQGDIVNGAYRVLAKLGEGGMGAVYKVEHLSLQRLFALKTIYAGDQLEAKQEAWQRFQYEAQTLAKLSHRNIIQIYDFGLTDSGLGYYTMDFVEGKTLSEKVREQGQLATHQALAIFIEVAEGLAYAHRRQLVHRDIKPSNIMLADNTTGLSSSSVKIIDFGLTAEIGNRKSSTGLQPAQQADPLILGSPPYMSPEQFQKNAVDYRSDIYSFGCTLFEALTGVPPFIGDSALVLSMKHITEAPPTLEQASLGRHFPTQLERLEERLLAKDPSQRYQDMKEVAQDLRAVLKTLDQGDSVESAQNIDAEKSATLKPDFGKFGYAPDVNQETTLTPLPQARTAQTLLILGSVVVVSALTGLYVLVLLPAQKVLMREKSRTASTALPALPAVPAVEGQPTDAARSPSEAAGDENPEGNSKQPYSKIIVDSTGTKMRVFQFPPKVSIGRIVDMDDRKSSGYPAKGPVIFKASKRLQFVPNTICCDSPAYFRRFRPDDLYEIDLTRTISISSETLNYLDHLSGLTKLRLVETELDDEVIPALDKLKGLTYLDLSNTEVKGKALAKMKTLSQLQTIRVNQMVDVSAVISALANSQKLEELQVDNTVLTKKDLEIITGIPHLRCLSICSTKIGLPGLAILSRCPNLTELTVLSCGYKITAVPVLRQFSNLRQLRITCDTWSAAEIAQLRQTLSDIKITVAERFVP